MTQAQPHKVSADHGIAATLELYGVDYAFGMRVIEEADPEITKPLVIHYESSAGLMAHAYARVSGKPGIVTVNRPGTPNMIMGLHEAWQSSVPLILLMDGVAPNLIGKNSIYEVDAPAMVEPVTKAIIDAPGTASYPEALRKAFRIATSGRPRPVGLHLIPDIGEQHPQDVDVFAEPAFTHYPSFRALPDPTLIEQAAELLSRAERPCIVAGGGVILSRAWDALRDLAERTQFPVATTISGKGAFDERHPLAAGATGAIQGGRYGRGRIADQIVKESDVVLLVGTRTNQMATTAWTVPDPRAKIIHIDVDPDEIGRNYTTSIGIVADARLALEALRAALSDFHPTANRTGQIKAALEEWTRDTEPFATSEQAPIHPGRLIGEISRLIGPNTMIVSDGSSPFMWASSHFFVGAGTTFLSPRGTGAIGTGLPMAMGAKLGAPGMDVICLEGDGGLMCGVLAEIETAAHYGIGVTTVVFNNGTLGHERFNMHAAHTYMDFSPGLDFAAVARGLRCDAIRVERPDQIRAALEQGVAAGRQGRPTLIDVVLHPAQYLRMPNGTGG
ncbi:MAG: thiamine pyrophosphate-binding protein [Chloroflexi bacterium]|nr:thiamine pyrophosphate-binding protein [Chloroflexota bacterium]